MVLSYKDSNCGVFQHYDYHDDPEDACALFRDCKSMEDKEGTSTDYTMGALPGRVRPEGKYQNPDVG